MFTTEALDIAIDVLRTDSKYTADKTGSVMDLLRELRADVHGEGMLWENDRAKLTDMVAHLRMGGLITRGYFRVVYGPGTRVVLDVLYGCGVIRELNVDDPDQDNHLVQWIK